MTAQERAIRDLKKAQELIRSAAIDIDLMTRKSSSYERDHEIQAMEDAARSIAMDIEELIMVVAK